MSNTSDSAPQNDLYGSRWIKFGLVAILTANMLASVYWVSRNIVLIGNDATQYLLTTLEYTQFLDNLSPQTLFQAFVYPPYRTPAIYIAAQPFVYLFGANMDGAQMLNVALLGAVVWATFLLARCVAQATTALWAAFFVGLFPVLSGMARLYYTEMFLTAVVLLSLLAIYRSDHFANRRWTYVLGAGIGVGLLVKWTMPIYIVAPLAWVVSESRALQQAWGIVKHPRIHARNLLVALAIGAALGLMWFLPNRSALLGFPLGDWIAPLWIALLTGFFYIIQRPASPLTNLAGAVLLAMICASLWYAPHADFASRLLAVDAERSQEAIGFFGAGNYLRYARFIYESQLGPLVFWMMAPLVIVSWFAATVWNRQLLRATAPLWLSLLTSIVILSALSQANTRNLAPLLPTWSVLAAVSLWLFPVRLRTVVAAIWGACLLLQSGMVTFDIFAGQYVATRALWAHSSYALAPASGETKPGYWIAPDILSQIARQGDASASLAILVNSRQLHRGVLKYVAAVENYPLAFNDATETHTRAWFEVFASEWVLLKDGDNRELEGDGRDVVERILAGDALFRALYKEEKRYTLPNGETVYLFHRTAGPGHPKADGQMVADAAAVAQAIARDWSPGTTIVYGDSDLAVWIGMYDPPADRFQILDRSGSPGGNAPAAANGVVMLVLDQSTGQAGEQLAADGYLAMSSGADRIWVEYYGVYPGQLQRMSADAGWSSFQLQSVDSLARVAPGEVIPLQLLFSGDIPPNSKISLRLTDSDHQVLASNDTKLAPNVRAGLFVSPQTPSNTYRVEAVIYDETTLQPLADALGNQQTALFEVEIKPIQD